VNLPASADPRIVTSPSLLSLTRTANLSTPWAFFPMSLVHAHVVIVGWAAGAIDTATRASASPSTAS
jgi:hypothetical protein